MALSRIDTTNMIEDVPQSKLDNNINFRNIIINGGMDIAQRGTSVSSTGDGYKTCDRWRYERGVGTIDLSQSTTVPTGQGFAKSFKVDVTASASPSAGDVMTIEQRFEGQNLQYLKKGTSSAESTTLSFWVRSTKTGTYICELQDVDNSRSISKSYTISSADTWEKKTITFAGDTTGALDDDNARSLDVIWYMSAGSNYTSGTLQTSWGSKVDANRAVGQVNFADSASNDFYLTGCQLEAGTSASDFEFLPVDVNKHRCLRYFQDLAPKENDDRFTLGENVNTTRCDPILYFKPELRATPSFSSTAANTFSLYHAGTSRDCTAVSMDSINNTGGNMLFSVSSGLTAGGCSQVLTNGTGTQCFFDAEL